MNDSQPTPRTDAPPILPQTASQKEGEKQAALEPRSAKAECHVTTLLVQAVANVLSGISG